MRLRALAAAALIAACSSAPDEPTWTRDVKPILQANCIKCHGPEPRGGAPSGLRLDVFENTYDDEGRKSFGAELVAFYVHARTDEETMPPIAPLSSVQIETLEGWAFTAAPRGEPSPDNQPPAIALLEPLELGADGFVPVRYEITDPDFDVVTGALIAAPVGTVAAETVTRELYSGRGTVQWDATAAGSGRYELRATLNDGHRELETVLGAFEVAAGANGAPSARFVQFPPEPDDPDQLRAGDDLRDRLIHDGDSPVAIEIELADPDGDGLSATLSAERGGESIEIASLSGVASGTQTIAFDTTGLDEGGNWWLRVTVSDGELEREALAGPLVIAHRSEGPAFDEGPSDILVNNCILCHPGLPIFPFDPTDPALAASYAGHIYRRVVQEQTMPPRSALLQGLDEMPQADRDLLRDWILAGAPIPESAP